MNKFNLLMVNYFNVQHDLFNPLPSKLCSSTWSIKEYKIAEKLQKL